MGTYYTYGASRKDIIEEITKAGTSDKMDRAWYTVAHTCRGNILWTVQAVVPKDGAEVRYIGCYLLTPSRDGWGYKPMDESVHPYYYTCPLKYLALVPEVQCQEWRDNVALYHRRTGQTLKVGQLIALTNGWLLEVTSVRPLRGTMGGQVYRIPRGMLTLNVPEVKTSEVSQ